MMLYIVAQGYVVEADAMRRTLVAVVAVALFVGCSSRGRKHHRSEFYIITNSLPKAYVGQSYSAMVEATGGVVPKLRVTYTK